MLKKHLKRSVDLFFPEFHEKVNILKVYIHVSTYFIVQNGS